MGRKISGFWAGLTILLCAAAVVLCLTGYFIGGNPLVAEPGGDPEETVTRFFEALTTGSYENACSYLDGYTDLGLNREPDSEEGRIILNALKSSYKAENIGKPVKDGLTASQRVSFTYLDIDAVNEAALELQSSTGDYMTALKQVVASAESCYRTEEMDITLNYGNGKWLIDSGEVLTGALLGGKA